MATEEGVQSQERDLNASNTILHKKGILLSLFMEIWGYCIN